MKKILTFLVSSVFALTAAHAQLPFAPLDTNFSDIFNVHVPAAPYEYDALFVGNTDYVSVNGGTDSALAKQNHDFIGYIPLGTGNDSCWLIVNQEITNTKNAKLGDGGGQTAFKIVKGNDGIWKVAPSIGGKKFHNVNFAALGGTNTNCGGGTTTYGTTLSGEEYPQNTNASLYASGTGIQDTSDYVIPAGNGAYSGHTLKRWQNYGWMVEANPKTAMGLKKYYSMGRYSHESGCCMSDGKTVYLTDDNTPAVLFKFIATTANDYTAGQLYAYKQGVGGVGGSWITLPMDIDSLIDIRTVALKKGASTFTRLEWAVSAPNGKVYITETGLDAAVHKPGLLLGGSMAYHNLRLDTLGGQPQDSTLRDYYGRVLELNPIDNNLRVYIEGGNGATMATNFSNPDAMSIQTIGGHNYLIMNEDLNGASQNRQPSSTSINNICEIYYVDLAVTNPTVANDLKRFFIAPKGAETTGGASTPDGKTYFVNIQHPSASNNSPFNNSVTIAIRNFANTVGMAEPEMSKEGFKIYPNPASRELFFNKTTDIAIYDVKGTRILTERNTNSINISELAKGIYFVQTIDGEVQRLIVD